MATTTNFGWETPDDTDLVKDGALAIRTLGSAIDTSLVDLKGGTTGQVLSKTSNTDMDFTWINNDQGDITEVQAGTGISVASGTGPIPVVTNTVATAFDAKGDLIGGTGADTFARLAVGTNNQVLTADSTTATGLKWATPASGGGFTLLSTTTISGTTTISSISGDYKHLFLYLKGMTSSQNADNVMMRFNSDSGANYTYANVRVLGTTVSGGANVNQGEIQIIDRVQTGAQISEYGSTGIWIYRYTSTDWIDGQSQALGHDNSLGMGQSISFRYDCSAAITSITFLSNNAATIAGTAYLYGVN